MSQRGTEEELEALYYAVSHDLRAPLRAVLNFSELLDRPSLPPEKAARYRAFVLDGARRMEAMLDGLLLLSRLGRDETPLEPVDGDALLDGALALVRPALERAGGDLRREPLPPVLVRPAALRRALAAILDNAVKFRRPEEPPRIEVRGTSSGDRVELSIRDHGIGIAEADRERALAVFGRLHHRAEYPGEGLGLAIARRAVEASEGTLRLLSPPDGGLDVRLVLRSGSAAHDHRAGAAPSPADGAPR
jgi:signal transduction histidine kinase